MDNQTILQTCGITYKQFEDAGLTWELVDTISGHYSSLYPHLIWSANEICAILQMNASAYALKLDIVAEKEFPEVLIKSAQKNKILKPAIDTYTSIVTDLIIIKVLITDKQAFGELHELILDNWRIKTNPVAYHAEQGVVKEKASIPGTHYLKEPLLKKTSFIMYQVESRHLKREIPIILKISYVYDDLAIELTDETRSARRELGVLSSKALGLIHTLEKKVENFRLAISTEDNAAAPVSASPVPAIPPTTEDAENTLGSTVFMPKASLEQSKRTLEEAKSTAGKSEIIHIDEDDHVILNQESTRQVDDLAATMAVGSDKVKKADEPEQEESKIKVEKSIIVEKDDQVTIDGKTSGKKGAKESADEENDFSPTVFMPRSKLKGKKSGKDKQ
ncbi:MAG: hypothetical protein GF398_12400 [Chitinivibrionales bacterium]|nr:hypothetical protein [Chitinivibrionales bacterium]